MASMDVDLSWLQKFRLDLSIWRSPLVSPLPQHHNYSTHLDVKYGCTPIFGRGLLPLRYSLKQSKSDR